MVTWTNSLLNAYAAVEEPLQNTVTDSLTYDEAVDELFSTAFNSIRDTSTNAIGTICDLIGELTFEYCACSSSGTDHFLKETSLAGAFNILRSTHRM